jgi:peptidoglycan/LPS O-acetylase OafA/YrhL
MPNTTPYRFTADRRLADVRPWIDPRPTTDALLRRVRRLTGAYLAVSLAAVAALVLHRFDHADGSGAAWVHAIIVAATAIGTFSASILAGRGQRGAFLRLRVASVVLVVAVIVIAALPGDFPLWMKLAELLGAALMAVVAATVNGPTLRAHFRRG